MSKKQNETLQKIMQGLAAYSNPTAVTSQVIASIITSRKTRDIVRKVLLDPVQSVFVPKIEAIGWDKCVEVFNAILSLLDDKRAADILEVTEAAVKSYRDDIKEHPRYGFSSYNSDLAELVSGASSLFRYKNAIVYFTANAAVYTGRGNKMDGQFKITLEFISPTHHVYEEFVDQIEKERAYIETGYYEQFERRIRIIRTGGRRGFQVSYATVPTTVVIERDIRDAVEAVISAVNRSDEIKEQFEVNKTIGVLLWGPPGTGKSTIVRYLAMRLKRSLILTSADNLAEVIDYAKERSGKTKYIILIEDIDFKFVDRRKLMESKKKKEDDTKEDTRSKPDDDDDEDGDWSPALPMRLPGSFAQTDTLFQLLDGVLGDSSIMVCATTNYKDRLDPALIRDGRFDHDIYVAGLSMADAEEVCQKFDVSPSDINLSSFTVPVNAASLQTAILKFKTTGKKEATKEA